ncbi:MAG TPA: MFS transporter [Streptosporangiaceae bacterium]|jgi:EmrB/QacA subfamily drug resistance transporter
MTATDSASAPDRRARDSARQRPGQPGSDSEGRQRAGRRERQILAVVLVGAFMAVLDTTIVNVALPSIALGTHAASADLEWVVSGYALTFGLALVTAGRFGDRFGYKLMFVAGLVVFLVASLACGLAQNSGQLIAARLVQGLGAGIYYPAISATIQRLFAGRQRSRAFGLLGTAVGLSTAIGPLAGGLLIQAAGQQNGWRWVFFINLFIGAAELPAAIRLFPRREHSEEHGLDPVGNLLLAAALLLFLFPLVQGRASGWPAWSWACLGGCAVAGAALAGWEIALSRRGGEPVIQVDLLRNRSFAGGQALAMLYFAGFTSLFFTLSILWQQGLGRSALATGLLVVPFALGSLLSASNSDRFSTRFGRSAILAGIGGMLAGQGLILAVLHLSPRPSAWLLTGPLALAGLGNGLVIAPNQDFVLGSVPRREAGTAGGELITAQRVGAAIGIAVIGTALFGSGSGGSSGGSGQTMPALVHTAQTATVVNLGFILAALLCALTLPRTLGAERAAENA